MHIHLNKHTISNSRSVSIQETGDGEGTKNHPFFLLVEYFIPGLGESCLGNDSVLRSMSVTLLVFRTRFFHCWSWRIVGMSGCIRQ